MKKILVKYDEWTTWNKIIECFEPLNVGSNLTRYNFGEPLPRDCENSFEAFKELLKKYDLSINEVTFMRIYAYIHFGEPLPRDCENSFEAFKELLKKYDLSINEVAFIPIYAYIHGDIYFSTGSFCDRWDSGVAGYVWAEKKEYGQIYGYKRFTKKIKNKLEKDVENLVKTLNSNNYYVEVYENEENEPILEFDLMMEYEDEDKVLEELFSMGAIKDSEFYEIEWVY